MSLLVDVTRDTCHVPRVTAAVTRYSFALFALGLGVNLISAYFIRMPGYMDAYYYFGGARQLSQGQGFSEPYVWNYLDNPARLPHPSHLYWMPLASIVAAASMRLLGDTFRGAQFPFLLLAALMPPLAAWLAWCLGRNLGRAVAAGLLAAFPGFYLIFWPNVDTFALFGLLGAGCLMAAWRGDESGKMRWWLLAGLLAGLAHLTRADGVLLLLVAAAWSLKGSRKVEEGRRKVESAASLFLFPFLILSSGYLLVMLPWLVRNHVAAGSILAPGGAAALWLRDYNELFSLRPATASAYFSQGFAAILAGKWQALLANLQTASAVQGMIFLWPFTLWGAWKSRGHPLVRLAALYYAALFALMTFAFSLPGARGGLFHSGTVVLPFVFALAPAGIAAAVEWVSARRRSWDPRAAAQVFTVGAVVLVVCLTALIFYVRVFAAERRGAGWNRADQVYAEIGPLLEPGSIVVVNNPPGFYYHTGHPAIVIPDGPEADLLAAADRFGADYVVLDANRPAGLAGIYREEESSPRLGLLEVLRDGSGRPVQLYEVLP